MNTRRQCPLSLTDNRVMGVVLIGEFDNRKEKIRMGNESSLSFFC